MAERVRDATAPSAPAGSGLHAAEFEAFLTVDEGKAPVTVKVMLKRLRYAAENGLEVEAFGLGAVEAQRAGRAYLAARRTSGASVHAYNNDVKVLKALARFHSIDRDVRFRKLPEPRAQFRALSEAEVRQLLDYRSAEREANVFRRALILWALKSGMRPSEIAAMDVADLDPKGSRFHVRKPAKGGRRRWLPLEPWVFSPKRPLGAWLAARPVPNNDPDALWTTTRWGAARRVSVSYLRQAISRAGRDVGVTVSCNITRHTRATELRRRGHDLLFIKEYLGHASVKSTEVYAEIRPEELSGILAKRPGRDFFSAEFGRDT